MKKIYPLKGKEEEEDLASKHDIFKAYKKKFIFRG